MKKLITLTGTLLFSLGLSSSEMSHTFCEDLAFDAVDAYFKKEGKNADGFEAGMIYEQALYVCRLITIDF